MVVICSNNNSHMLEMFCFVYDKFFIYNLKRIMKMKKHICNQPEWFVTSQSEWLKMAFNHLSTVMDVSKPQRYTL